MKKGWDTRIMWLTNFDIATGNKEKWLGLDNLASFGQFNVLWPGNPQHVTYQGHPIPPWAVKVRNNKRTVFQCPPRKKTKSEENFKFTEIF